MGAVFQDTSLLRQPCIVAHWSGDEQPGLIWKGGPGAGHHNRVENRGSKQKSEGCSEGRAAGQHPARNWHVSAFTCGQSKTHQGSRDRSQQCLPWKSPDPGGLRDQPAGQPCDENTEQQKWNRLQQQALIDGPGGRKSVQRGDQVPCVLTLRPYCNSPRVGPNKSISIKRQS